MSRPKGCKISEEHKAKLSEAAKKRYEDKKQRELAAELTKKQWSKYSKEERKQIIKDIGFTCCIQSIRISPMSSNNTSTSVARHSYTPPEIITRGFIAGSQYRLFSPATP